MSAEAFLLQCESLVRPLLDTALRNARLISCRHIGPAIAGRESRLVSLVTFRTEEGEEVPLEAFTVKDTQFPERPWTWETYLSSFLGEKALIACPEVHRPPGGEPELCGLVYFDLDNFVRIRLANPEDPFRLSGPLIGEGLAETLRTGYGSVL